MRISEYLLVNKQPGVDAIFIENTDAETEVMVKAEDYGKFAAAFAHAAGWLDKDGNPTSRVAVVVGAGAVLDDDPYPQGEYPPLVVVPVPAADVPPQNIRIDRPGGAR